MNPTLIGSLLVFGILSGCASSPLGRNQLAFLPDSQMETMGVQAFQDLKSKTPIEQGAAANNYVKCIANPLTEVVSKREAFAGKNLDVPATWEIVVFKDDSANAFALPGGKIGVHTGLLKVATTPDQVAAVIGHEIGHVLARHSNERVSESYATQGGLVAVGALTKEGPKKNMMMGLLGVGAQVGLLLPHSRTQESEADVIGLELMARAGFDPAQSVELWKNMTKAGGGAPPEFLSTHPSGDTRIQNLSSRLGAVSPLYNAAKAQGRHPTCKL
jgi:predicted Zn-dependent protease